MTIAWNDGVKDALSKVIYLRAKYIPKMGLQAVETKWAS